MAGNDGLTTKQKRFVRAMLTAPTVEKAARAAGIAERTGTRYLTNPAVRAELSRQQDAITAAIVASLTTLAGEATETLRESMARLSEQAQGSVADFVEVDDQGGWRLDLARARDAGLLHLVKKLWIDASENERLELHDAQAATVKLARLALDVLAEKRKAAELDDLTRRVEALEEKLGR